MQGASDSKRSDPPQAVTVETVQAKGNAIVAGKIGTLIIQNIQRAGAPAAQKSVLPEQPDPPPLPPDDPRVHLTQLALAHLRQPQTCIYLGRRYGLTPHAPASDLLDDLAIGADPPSMDSLAEAMGWLAGHQGLTAARRHLNERYADLDEVSPEVDDELKALAPHVAGRVLVTGSYSARIQNALGPNLTIAHDDPQVEGRLTPGRSERAHLLMLHGTEQSFQNAMVVEDDVAMYPEHRPRLAAEVSALLELPWIALGAEKKADNTFHLLASNICRKLGLPQRPIFVVDPRPEAEVAIEWPREALRHVGLTPAQFLFLARSDHDA